MPKMRFRSVATLITAVFTVEACLLHAEPERPAWPQRARAQLRDAIAAGEVAGGAHLVVREGKTLYLEIAGVCDVEEKTPFQADTIVRIYSMTKPITSVAAMMLFERGKFQLDDPVAKFIPAFAKTTVLEKDGDAVKTVPAKRAITVRDVFRHTTGYSYGEGKPSPLEHYKREGVRYRPPLEMLPPKMSIERAAEALARIPALHHPGDRFTYGFNTDLLGRLIEVWSGKALDEYMEEAIFEPLQMVDTGFSVAKEKRSRFASCHTVREGKLVIVDKAASSEFNEGFEFLSGGGGLVSTIKDYANFCQMLVDGGEFKGHRLLEKESLKLMFADQLNDDAGDFRFGLGFAIGEVELGVGEDKRKATQYSWGGYASTAFRIIPEERLFQIVLRQRVPYSNDLANQLFSIVYRGIGVARTFEKDTDSWTRLPDMPVPRWEAGTVVLDGKLYVFGGYEKPTKSTKRVDVFDPKDNSWRKLADLPSAITHMNAVLDGRSVWIAGGFKDGYKGYAISEVWRYDVDKNTYTAAPSLPKPRAGGGLALVGRRLHYIGGLKPDRLTDAPEHWVLDLNSVAKDKGMWESAPAMPSPRNQFGTVTFGGKIYVMGGQFGHDRGQDDQARMDIYDSATGTWKRGADLPKPHSHAEGSTFVSREIVFMMGGMTREGRRRRIDDAIWGLSANGKWKVLGKLPRRLSSPAAAILGDRLYVAGGSLNGAHPQPGMWVRPWPGSASAGDH